MGTPAPPPRGPGVAVRPCPVCGNTVAYDAVICPSCGSSLQSRRGPDLVLVAAGVLAVVVGVLLAILIGRGDNNNATPVSTVPATTAITTPATPAPAPVAPAPAPAPAPTTTPAVTVPPTTAPAPTTITNLTLPPQTTPTTPKTTTTKTPTTR